MADTNWGDFTNNFATDIAPIIALFGEQVTKQFLSESMTFRDSIIFGVAPLGIITAVVSVIRVYGNSSLKSLIGRSHEPHGVAEAELCSSTSEDVCELWSNGGICRVFGRPKILEFIFSRGGQYYPKYGDNVRENFLLKPATCGIELPKQLLGKLKPHDNNGVLATGNDKLPPSSRSSLSASSEAESGRPNFAPHPNLSLNVGTKRVPGWALWLVTIFSILLQLSFFGYATWATYYNPSLYQDPDENPPPQTWSFCTAVAGTVLLVSGMIFCSSLIERKSKERWFVGKEPSEKHGTKGPIKLKEVSSPRSSSSSGVDIFWLQPGGQRVGDQLFNSFAFSQRKNLYVTSWKVEDKNSNTGLIPPKGAVASSIIGFILQFIGLRGLHGSIALYQVASTLLMALVRALLRSKRLPWDQNKLGSLDRDIKGHELDWQAIDLECSKNGYDFNITKPHYWHIDADSSQTLNPEAAQLDESKYPNVKLLLSPVKNGPIFAAFCPKDSDTKCCINAAVDWIRNRELEAGLPTESLPNVAARIMHYRSRLAYLTGNREFEDPLPLERQWDTDIRSRAISLRRAIRESADYIFSSMELEDDWKNAHAIVWSANCSIKDLSVGDSSFPICFLMIRNHRGWVISEYQIEAVLGLWMWSLKQITGQTERLLRTQMFPENSLYNNKSLLVHPNDAARYEGVLNLWCMQSDSLTKKSVSISGSSSASEGPLLLSMPTALATDATTRTSTTPASYNATLLTTEAKSRPIEIMAQDIFGAFMQCISGILKPLQDALPRQPRDDIRSYFLQQQSRPFLGLVNPHVEMIAEKAGAAELGSQRDILMSIVPTLFQRSKLPDLEQAFQGLIIQASSFRREGKLVEAEDLLKGLLQLGSASFRERVVRGLSETYRAGIRSGIKLNREFGWQGFNTMHNICQLPDLSTETRETLEHYVELSTYLTNQGFAINSIPMKKQLPSSDILSNELQQTRAKSRGLNVSMEYDLSTTDQVSSILVWAIKHSLSELVEDLSSLAPAIINHSLGFDDYNPNLRPIFWPLKHFDEAVFEAILAWPSLDVNMRDSLGGHTPLMAAVSARNHIAVQMLLKLNLPLNELGSLGYNGATALMIACANGSYEIVQTLIDAGADVHVQGARGNALAEAIRKGNLQIVEYLINNPDAKANVNYSITRGTYTGRFTKGDAEACTALVRAVVSEQFKVFEYLIIKGGADVNLEGISGTALSVAAGRGKVEWVELLLSTGTIDVDKDLQVSDHGSALLQAVTSTHKDALECIKLLVSKGKAKVNRIVYQGGYNTCALLEAIHSRKSDAIKYLIEEAGADLKLQVKSYRCIGPQEDLFVTAVQCLSPHHGDYLDDPTEIKEFERSLQGTCITYETVKMIIARASHDIGKSVTYAAKWGEANFFRKLLKNQNNLGIELTREMLEDALRAARTKFPAGDFSENQPIPDDKIIQDVQSDKRDIIALLEEYFRLHSSTVATDSLWARSKLK